MATENFLKSGHVVFEIRVCKHRQTDERNTHTLVRIFCTSIGDEVILKNYGP